MGELVVDAAETPCGQVPAGVVGGDDGVAGAAGRHERHRTAARRRGECTGRAELVGQPHTAADVRRVAVAVAAQHDPYLLAELEHDTAVAVIPAGPHLERRRQLALDHAGHLEAPPDGHVEAGVVAFVAVDGGADERGVAFGEGAVQRELGARARRRRGTCHRGERDELGDGQPERDSTPRQEGACVSSCMFMT